MVQDLKTGLVITDGVATIEETIRAIILDYKKMGINSFEDWLLLYDETMDENEQFVNEYCQKIRANQINEIETWLKIFMLNSIALYMIEMDIDVIPNEMINRIVAVYNETIRYYNMCKKGYLKLNGNILISDITSYKFSKIDE